MLVRKSFIAFIVYVASKDSARARSFKFSESSSVEDAVKQATEPLHRQIGTLREELETFEARHDTLEAATEQFRIKTKSLKEKLDEERIRYDTLVSSKHAIEEKLNAEVTNLQETRREYEGRVSSLEKSLEIVMDEDKEKDMAHQKELQKVATESAQIEKRLKDSESKKDNLIQALKSKETMVNELTRENSQLKQQLSESDAKVRELEGIERRSFWVWFHDTIIESEELHSIIQFVRESCNWFFYDVIPFFKNIVLQILSTVKSFVLGSYRQAGDFASQSSQSLSGGAAMLTNKTRSIQMNPVHIVVDMIGHAKLAIASARASMPSAREMSESGTIHQGLVAGFEACADALSRLCEDNENLQWLHDLSSFVKAHSQAIVIGAEVVLALLLIDFAISAMFPSPAPSQAARVLKQARVSPQKPVVSHGSLLRKSRNYPGPSRPEEYEECSNWDNQSAGSWEIRTQYTSSGNW